MCVELVWPVQPVLSVSDLQSAIRNPKFFCSMPSASFMCFLDNHSRCLIGNEELLIAYLWVGLRDDESSHFTNLDFSFSACHHRMGGVGPCYDSQCPLVSAAANQSRPR